MLDLTGLPALDLAIGLAFIFFLLATLALTIQEFIAAILGLRARTLEQGLRSLLEDPDEGWRYVDKFYNHDLIKSLYRTDPPDKVKKAAATIAEKAGQEPAKKTPKAAPPPTPEEEALQKARAEVAAALGKNAHKGSRGKLARAAAFFKPTRGPSYISPRSFALVVLDNFAPEEGRKTVFDQGMTALDDLPAGLSKRLKPLVEGAQKDVEKLRIGLEAWYDDTMARVSGWYKRKTQIILIVIGIIMVPAINANTIAMAERLWKDDTVRSAVVAQSQANAKEGKNLTGAADDVDAVLKVGIPMGWRGDAVPHGDEEIALAIGGWLLTIFAISLGAPFWFDALSRFSRLRSSGKPETPLPAAASGRSNERIITPPQEPTSAPSPPQPSREVAPETPPPDSDR
jgi:hypothetical protein